jgi:hypothetical protein
MAISVSGKQGIEAAAGAPPRGRVVYQNREEEKNPWDSSTAAVSIVLGVWVYQPPSYLQTDDPVTVTAPLKRNRFLREADG